MYITFPEKIKDTILCMVENGKILELCVSKYQELPPTLSGSDQTKSQSSPVTGVSIGLGTRLIWSRDFRFGLRPPCTQNIFSPTTAATGSHLNISPNSFHKCSPSENLVVPVSDSINLIAELRRKFKIRPSISYFSNDEEKGKLLAFYLETVTFVDRITLVIAAKNEESVWIFNFIGHKQ